MFRRTQVTRGKVALACGLVSCVIGVAVIESSSQEAVQRQNRSAPVTVVNTPLPVTANIPLPVTVTNQPATSTVTPFIGRCILDLNQAQNCAVDILTRGGGTGGKQIVVQAVSAIVTGLDPGAIPLSAFFGGPVLDGVDAGFYHYVPLSLQGKDPGGAGYFAGMQSLTWIQDPRATRVVCGVLLLAQSVLNGRMTCLVTGYLQ
jgi:hypothetical protein